MYKYTRQDVSDLLNISTRSVDRYIRSWKLRSKKDGKIIYIHSSDVDSIKNSWGAQEVIIPWKVEEEVRTKEQTVHNIPVTKEVGSTWNSNTLLSNIYEDLKQQINKKDEIIQTLSVRLGKAEEIAKNSISLVEFKKSQFLLEESKGFLSNEVETLKKDRSQLSKDLKYEKNTNQLMVAFLVFLLIFVWIIWFVKI